MARSLFLLCGVLSSLAQGVLGRQGVQHWPISTFETGPWKPAHLALWKSGDVDPGSIFISVRSNDVTQCTAPTIYDNNGDMVWQGPFEKTMDLKQQKLFGKDVLTYWDGETGVMGYGYGKVHILDDTYKEIHTVTLEDDDIVTPNGQPRKSYIDVHEHFITPHNTIIVSAINITTTKVRMPRAGPTDIWVIDPLFYEIDVATNKVLFKWDALEHLHDIPVTKSKNQFWGGKSREQPWDAYHMNSVHPTKDGYLVSIRFFHSTYYINKDGSVRWQLSGAKGEGDFDLKGARFSWQHDARVYNETEKGLVLTLFNNAGTRAIHKNSKGLALNVDLENMTAKPIVNLDDPTDHLQTGTQGSMQLLDNGHKFVGYGSVCKVKEFDANGNTVLVGQFGRIHRGQSYRAFKYPWHATPHWAPAIAVKHSTPYTTDVYMSWNGATDYDNWVILSVPDMNSNATHAAAQGVMPRGTQLAKHDRTGFETHVAFADPEAAQYITAVARQGEKVLHASPIVPFSSRPFSAEPFSL